MYPRLGTPGLESPLGHFSTVKLVQAFRSGFQAEKLLCNSIHAHIQSQHIKAQQETSNSEKPPLLRHRRIIQIDGRIQRNLKPERRAM